MTFKQHFHGLDFTFCMPGKPLSDFVNCFVEISGKPQQTTVRNFPVLKSEVTFNLSGIPLHGKLAVAGNPVSCNQTMLTGTMTRWQNFFLPEYIHIIGINYKPECFRKLFNVAPFDLTDKYVDGNLCISELDGIWYQLMERKTPARRFEIMHQWMMAKIRQSNYYEDGLIKGIKEQCTLSPHITVRQIEQWSGYSRQYLFMKFKEHIGIGVKQYLELLRLQHVLHDLKSGQYDDPFSLTHKHNFHDQSHLIHTFKRLTGLTPNQARELFLPKQDAAQKGFSLSYT